MLPARSFRTGMIVRLVSGGPLMTVLKVDELAGDVAVVCRWFDAAAAHEEAFPPETVRPAPTEAVAKSLGDQIFQEAQLARGLIERVSKAASMAAGVLEPELRHAARLEAVQAILEGRR